MEISSKPYPDIHTAFSAYLELLGESIPFDLWMITRTSGNDWIVLESRDRAYDVHSGKVFRWADSFCSRMVKGLGPNYAPSSDEIPAYRSAPIGGQVHIESYLGAPIRLSDGSLFGTLCAISPQPRQDQKLTTFQQKLLEAVACTLSTMIEHQMKSDSLARALNRELEASLTDHLTGLVNRRGWEGALQIEEERCQRLEGNAAVFMIDLDELKNVNDKQGHEAGDTLLARAAEVLRGKVRAADVVARLGGDEFGLLMVDCDEAAAGACAMRLREGLDSDGVAASFGFAMRRQTGSLQTAFGEADRQMYQQKQTRKYSS